jgi:uncharacterized protein (TIGR03437 family)
MPIRILSLALIFGGACSASFRVGQILQVPLQRAQAVSSLATDGNGNFIVTGINVDGGFICKLDPNGNVIFKFANFGAFPAGAVADPRGDIYWFGSGGGTGFPFPFTKTVLSVPQLGSSVPGFVVKFRGVDGSIVWAVEIGAMDPTAIALDADGLPILAGFATTAPGLTTHGAYLSPSTGAVAPLSVVRLSAAGDAIFAAAFGGHSINGTSTCVSAFWFRCVSDPVTGASAVLLDPQGNIWVAGSTNEIDLPVTPNAVKRVCGCSLNSGDGYLAEFSADGSDLIYATYLGTSTDSQTDTRGDDTIWAAVMDSSAHIWLVGSTNGQDFPVTANSPQQSLAGDSDGFVLEYDTASNKLVYGTYYGTQADNSITQIVIRPDGVPIVAGYLDYDRISPYSSGYDFVAAVTSLGIDAVSLPRDGADGGLALAPSGSLVAAGSRSVLTVMDEATSSGPNILGIVNSASLDGGGQVSPGEVITIVGANLGPADPVNAQVPTGGKVATLLGGVRVLFDGVAAPLLYVSSSRVTVIVPFGISSQQESTLVVENNGVISNQARIGIVSAVPAIYGGAAVYQHLPVAAALNQDGTINTRSNPATPGSIVSVFGTGIGTLVPQPADGTVISGATPALRTDIVVFVGPGGPAEVLYAGPAPGEVAGIMQVNFRLPDDLNQTPTILLFAGGWSAPYFTVWVKGT